MEKTSRKEKKLKRSRMRNVWITRTRLSSAQSAHFCKYFAICFCQFEEEEKKKVFLNFCKFLAGSFSAVPKPSFASIYDYICVFSIFQARHDLLPFAPLQSQNFSEQSVQKSATSNNSAYFCTAPISAI